MDPARDAATALSEWMPDGEAGARAQVVFAPSLPVLRGHFPGQPLVPGVHLLAAIAEVARRALGPLELIAVERAKWTVPVQPGEALQLEARWRERDGRVTVDGTVRTAKGVCATCRLALRR
jgi:3-hydroxyacyl-[acyl-carrier-protein] dehydratase